MLINELKSVSWSFIQFILFCNISKPSSDIKYKIKIKIIMKIIFYKRSLVHKSKDIFVFLKVCFFASTKFWANSKHSEPTRLLQKKIRKNQEIINLFIRMIFVVRG